MLQKKIYYKKLNKNVVDLAHSSELHAGLNLCTRINITNKTGRILIPTGIVIQIPVGFIGQVFLKDDIGAFMTLRNSHIIDHSCVGEVKLLVNVDNANHNILPFDVIAELVIMPIANAKLIETWQIGAIPENDNGE